MNLSNTFLLPMMIAGAIYVLAFFVGAANKEPPLDVTPVADTVCCLVELPEFLPAIEEYDIYEVDVDVAAELVTIPNKINKEQAALLKYAYEVAKADGHKDPSVLQGLIWQESKAGGYPGYAVAGDEYGLAVGKRYYGIGQIKVAAAQDVFRSFPEDFLTFYRAPVKEKQPNGATKTIVPGRYLKTEDEIIAFLIMDDKFNIRVASKYLWIMTHNTTSSPIFVRPTNYAITAYNRGLGNTYDTDYNNWHYTVSVHKHKDTFIKEFNIANNIAK